MACCKGDATRHEDHSINGDAITPALRILAPHCKSVPLDQLDSWRGQQRQASSAPVLLTRLLPKGTVHAACTSLC